MGLMVLHNKEARFWLLLIVMVGSITAVITTTGLLSVTAVGVTGFFLGVLVIILFAHQPGTLIIVYLVALPVYTLTMAFLYQMTGSVALIRLLQPWKEVVAMLVLLLVLLQTLVRYRLPRPHLLDILVLVFFGLNLLYLVLPLGYSLSVRVYGFRANTFWVIIYWLGRLVPLSHSKQKWVLGLLVMIGVLAGLVTLIEIVSLPANWPVHIGLMEYLQDFFGTSPRGHYGLTWTFETATGLRRRSAFWANPLELASSTLITGMATLFILIRYQPRTWGRFWATVAFGLIVLSLLLSISRASLMAFTIQMFVTLFWLRKQKMTIFYLLIPLAGIVFLFSVANQQITSFIGDTVTFQNASSQGHLDSWVEGVEAIRQHPWGLGLGSSGHIGSRFGNQVGGENQFVILGVDIGLVGLGLYLLILLSAIWFSLRAFYRTQGVTQGLTFVAAAAKLGLLIPAFTSHIEVYVFAMFVTWWLVGFSVQQLVRVKGRKASLGEAHT